VSEIRKVKLKEYDKDSFRHLPTTTCFKYLGTSIDQEGGCEKEIQRRIAKTWDR